MVKRLCTLVLALAVASAPVAREVCQITCESKAAQPATSPAEGHHHLPADRASSHEHSGTPHHLSSDGIPCDHGNATPSLVAVKNSDSAVSLPLGAPVSHSIATVQTRDVVSVRESAWSGGRATPLAIPLRV